MTDHAYTALTRARLTQEQIGKALTKARISLAAAPADDPRYAEVAAALARWERQWDETLQEIARLQEARHVSDI